MVGALNAGRHPDLTANLSACESVREGTARVCSEGAATRTVRSKVLDLLRRGRLPGSHIDCRCRIQRCIVRAHVGARLGSERTRSSGDVARQRLDRVPVAVQVDAVGQQVPNASGIHHRRVGGGEKVVAE